MSGAEGIGLCGARRVDGCLVFKEGLDVGKGAKEGANLEEELDVGAVRAEAGIETEEEELDIGMV